MRSCSWRWCCTARSMLSNVLSARNSSWNTSNTYTCSLLSAATPSGGPYTRARAARTFSADMRSSSVRTRGGHAAVQLVHDAHQLEHVIHIEIRARLLRVEGVPVA